MEIVIGLLLLVVIIRNIRKDKSDGRDMLGGGKPYKRPGDKEK